MKWFLALIIVSYFLGALWAHVGAQDSACYPINPSGEGFPRIYCPLTGEVWYQDMDGTDGVYGTEGDGVWKVEGIVR
jgi:hypothetical protein